MLKVFYAILLTLICLQPAWSQKRYTAADVHSHNDYTRPNPFYQAFKAGVGAIEADVYLRNGKLMVAHDTADIRPENTLKAMYLDPIKKEMGSHGRPLNLLIDLKESYTTLLPALIKEIAPLLPLMKTQKNNAKLAIIITGNRPLPSLYQNYPNYIVFDDDLQQPHTPAQWKRVAQVSLNFDNYSKWKGDGKMLTQDERAVRSIINATHRAGRKIRFWNAPDNAIAWQKLMDLGANILCTDKIGEITAFLKAN